MRFKRLLALLLAAALALSVLLTGCKGGGGESLAQVILNLLDGKYPNISIEIDPDLEADLRQAISQAEAENAGDDDAVIRAALEKLVGSTVTFRNLGEGQQGDTTFDLVFYAGTDPDKAAQAAYSQWNIVFANVPDDGKYGTGLAMVETENGIWMLVKATVEKAGSRDDEPDPVTLKSLSVTGPSKTFQAGNIFEKTGMVVTATYSDGTTKDIDLTQCTLKINGQPAENYRFTEVKPYSLTVSFGGQTATVTIPVSDNANGYYQDSDGTYFVTGSNGLQKLYSDLEDTSNFTTAKITLNSPVTLDDAWPENITFSGTLNGNGNTITMEGDRKQGLFDEINGGTVKNVHLQIDGTIRDGSGTVGGIAGTLWKGTITGCSVELNGGSIQATATGTGDALTLACAGGIVGTNVGTIEHCDVTISGSITADASSTNGSSTTEAHAGGIAGLNDSAIESSCSVELNCGSIQATATGTEDARTYACAGGIAGITTIIDGVECGPATGTGTIQATVTSSNDDSVTLNLKGDNPVTVNPEDAHDAGGNTYSVGNAYAGTKTVS